MTHSRFARLTALALLFSALQSPDAAAQSVVVDQGTFSIEINGTLVGTEEFSIRRAGFNRDAVFITNDIVTLRDSVEDREIRHLLRASGPNGAAEGYELSLSGHDPLEITMNLARPRFVSRFDSPAGQEEREFRARPDTRILETDVAHHYYFLRTLQEGDTAPIIVPRDRTEGVISAGPSVEEELRLGRNRVAARRVTFMRGASERRVWFDRQGRVLRVEIPERGYVATRTDLIG